MQLPQPLVGWPVLLVSYISGCTSDTPSPDKPSDPSGDSAIEDTESEEEDEDSADTDVPVDWPADPLILDQVTVLDARGPHPDRAVVIVGDEIWAVMDARGDWPEDATVRALPARTVIPGLIDAHIHLFHAGSPYWVGDTLTANLSAYLDWGVTGAVDLGSPREIFALRDRVLAGELVGPRLWVTGPFLTATGSHPCETVNDEALCLFVDREKTPTEQVTTLAEADGLKVALADADFTPWPTPRLDVGDLAEITAATDQPVWGHVDEPDDVEDAIASGVDVMAHPVFSEAMDDYPDVVTVSTIGAFDNLGRLLDGQLLREDLRATPVAVQDAWTWIKDNPDTLLDGWISSSARWSADARHNLGQAIAQERIVLAGSDAGYWFVPHGLGLHLELIGLVEAGMTPLQALTAATIAPAEVLGWDDVGIIDAGYRADLVVLTRDPLEDIANTQHIEAVYQGGQLMARGADPLLTVASGDGFCLDDRDCGAQRCDPIDHVCRDDCGAAFDRTDSCGAEGWCMPSDGIVAADGICHPGAGCDWRSQDCEPAYYQETCAPIDLDTNRCVISGTRQVGETCAWNDAFWSCQPGLFCSWVDYQCYALCDPDDPNPGCNCVRQSVEGQPWFGVCL
ncbi:MAG: amidohydrolase family protein [Myxococcota bacterium]